MRIFKKVRKNQLITLLDIGIIVVIMIVFKTYYQFSQNNHSSIEKNGIKYTFYTDESKYEKDQIIQFNFSMKNKKKDEKTLEFNRSNIFNILIEKDNEIIYKRDFLDSLTHKPKKIIIKRYGERKFSYEWYQEDKEKAEIERGLYKVTLYSLDLDIKLAAEFSIE